MNSNETKKTSRDATFTAEALPLLPQVARFARTLTHDPVDAEDLVQETFLRAYDAWDEYEPGSNCRSWLFTICRHIYLRQVRREARMVTTEDPEAEAMASAGLYHYAARKGLDTMFDRIDLRPAIQRAIGSLTDEYRDVLVLVDLQDLAYHEAANTLGVPIGTVRSRLFRARRLLQQSLVAFAEDAGLVGLPTPTPAPQPEQSFEVPCTEVIHQLWDYLDGELSADRAGAIRQHLELCAGCRAVSEFEAAFSRSVRVLVDDPPPDEELHLHVLGTLERHGYDRRGG